MRSRVRLEPLGRGVDRGLFVCTAMLCIVVFGCRKKSDTEPDGGTVSGADVAINAAFDATTAGDGGGDASGPVDVGASSPEPLAPPWQEATTLDAVEGLSDRDIGRLSGELYGTDRPVRAVVRARCPQGTFLQVVYDVDGETRVTPVVPLRFFELPTHAVTYAERPFEVRLNLTAAAEDRLAGTVSITYEREGEQKTYMNLEVDGAPLSGLLPPEMGDEENFPEFPSCHPTGWFRATMGDGRTAEGMMNASLAEDGNGALVTVPFSAQTGARFVVLRKPGTTGPYTLDLSGSRRGGGFQVVPEAYFVPELTSASDAQAGNIGEEQTVRMQEGEVDVSFGAGKRPQIRLEFRDLVIPMLLDGPLRGTTLKTLSIETVGMPATEYPEPPSEPAWRSEEATDGR